MAAIVPFLEDPSVFDPEDIKAMSTALEDVCHALNISADAVVAREKIALRIISLARRGERNATFLRDRVLKEADGAADAVPRLRPVPGGDLSA